MIEIADWIIEHIKDYSDDEMEFIGKLECLIERLKYDTGDCYVDFILGLDLYRIYSLLKILNMPFLDEDKKALIEKTLKQKAKTYIAGCLKRGKVEEAQRIKELINSHS